MVWGQQSCVAWIPRSKHCQPSPFSSDQGKDRCLTNPLISLSGSRMSSAQAYSVAFPDHICKTEIAKGILNPVANLTTWCFSSPRRTCRGQKCTSGVFCCYCILLFEQRVFHWACSSLVIKPQLPACLCPAFHLTTHTQMLELQTSLSHLDFYKSVGKSKFRSSYLRGRNFITISLGPFKN